MIKRFTILFCFISFFTLPSVLAQKIRYKDIKNNYPNKEYRINIDNPKYSPAVAGICSYIFPGAGHLYVGEPLRGAYFLGGEFVASGIVITGLVMSMCVVWIKHSFPYISSTN